MLIRAKKEAKFLSGCGGLICVFIYCDGSKIGYALIAIFVCIIATETKHRGLVKWYDRGLQNLWWEFDSLIPCY